MLASLGAGLAALFPWGLAQFGIVTEAAALECLSPLFAAAGLLLSSCYVSRQVENKRYRRRILLLNPVLYYLAGLILLHILLALETWHGFDLAP